MNLNVSRSLHSRHPPTIHVLQMLCLTNTPLVEQQDGSCCLASMAARVKVSPSLHWCIDIANSFLARVAIIFRKTFCMKSNFQLYARRTNRTIAQALTGNPRFHGLAKSVYHPPKVVRKSLMMVNDCKSLH